MRGFRLIQLCGVAVVAVLSASGQELPEVVARYEAVLERSPERGAAFDKVYAHFLGRGELDALARRWGERAAGEETGAVAFVLLGALLDERMNDAGAAREGLERYTSLRPDDARGWVALGRFAQRGGRLSEAAGALERALERTGDRNGRIELFREIAGLYARQLEFGTAAATWRRAIEEFPGDPDVIEQAAELFIESHEYDEARRVLAGGIERAGAGQRVRLQMRLARVDELEGLHEDAVAKYDALLDETAATSWVQRELRGRIEAVFRQQDDVPGLVVYYEGRLKGNPRDVESARRLAGALRELRRETDAMRWLKQAAEWAPEREELQVEVAQAMVDAGRPGDALGILDRLARESAAGERRFAEQIGEAQWKQYEVGKSGADRDAAIATWWKLAPEDAPRADGHLRLAGILDRHGLRSEAADALRLGLEIEPAAGDVRERLGELLIGLGRDGEAWEALAGLVPAAGAAAEDYARLARVQRMHGRIEDAKATVRKGLEAHSGDIELCGIGYECAKDSEDDEEALDWCERLLETADAVERIEELEGLKAGHLAALDRADSTARALAERLQEDGGLPEAELRLLIRLGLARDFRTAAAAGCEAGRRGYPGSVLLARLRLAFAQQYEDAEAQLAVLDELERLDAANRAEWLRRRCVILQDAGDGERAVAAAKAVIDASPANADGYIFAADVAQRVGRSSQAIQWLREAAHLSDRPQGPLMRLARVYRDEGNLAEAMIAYREAFEAEEEAQGKLAAVSALAEVAVQEGSIGELIEEFQRRQRGEGEDGWRYALYLAAIYETAGDVTLAREQIEKALAVRPGDAALLRRLIALSEWSHDQRRAAEYRERLFDAEPSAANALDLAAGYFAVSRKPEALAIVRRHLDDWRAQPQLLGRVLLAASRAEAMPELREMVAEAADAHPDSWELRLCEIEIRLAEEGAAAVSEMASGVFRDTLARPETALAPAASGGSQAGRAAAAGMPSGNPYGERLARYQHFASLLGNYFENIEQARQGGAVRITSTPLSQVAAMAPRDLAHAIHAVLAKKAEANEPASKALRKAVDEAGLGDGERLLLFAEANLAEAQKEALDAIEAADESDRTTDEFALAVALELRPGDDRARSVVRTLLDRTATEGPEWRNQPLLRIAGWRAAGDSERANELLRETVANADVLDSAQFDALLDACIGASRSSDLDLLLDRRIEELRKAGASTGWTRGALFERIGRFQQDKDASEARIAIEERMMEAFLRLSGPDGWTGTGRTSVNADGVVVPTSFFGASQVQSLQRFLSATAKGPRAGLWRSLFKRTAGELAGRRRELAEYLLAMLDWSTDRRDTALAEVDELAAAAGDPGLALTRSRMLKEMGRPREALDALRAASSGTGAFEPAALAEAVALAKELGDVEAAREAVSKLARGRLDVRRQQTVALDLVRLGLRDEAWEVAKRSSSPLSNRASDLVQEMRSLAAEGKRDEAIRIGDKLLAGDPATGYRPGFYEPAEQAIRILAGIDDLDRRKAEWEEQLKAAPDSQRLLLLLAWASGLDDGSGLYRYVSDFALPGWLRITRRGETVEGEVSADGRTWTKVGSSRFPMGRKALVGFVEHAGAGSGAASVYDSIVVEENGERKPLDSSWTATVLGGGDDSGEVEIEDGRVRIAGRPAGGPVARALFFHRTLDGDGSVAARVRVSPLSRQNIGANITMRESKSLRSCSARVYASNQGYAGFAAHSQDERGLACWKRLAELRPGDDGF
jgi:tetratricopeptide (TPR) repeat protein